MRISDWSSDVCSADLRPHPFIPHPLQRARALPHASADRELAYAKTQLDGWRRRSGSVVLSHAAAEAGTELAPSPLLAPWLDRSDRLHVDGLPPSWQAHAERGDAEARAQRHAPGRGKRAR